MRGLVLRLAWVSRCRLLASAAALGAKCTDAGIGVECRVLAAFVLQPRTHWEYRVRACSRVVNPAPCATVCRMQTARIVVHRVLCAEMSACCVLRHLCVHQAASQPGEVPQGLAQRLPKKRHLQLAR